MVMELESADWDVFQEDLNKTRENRNITVETSCRCSKEARRSE
jgi:hypothetical protein